MGRKSIRGPKRLSRPAKQVAKRRTRQVLAMSCDLQEVAQGGEQLVDVGPANGVAHVPDPDDALLVGAEAGRDFDLVLLRQVADDRRESTPAGQ